jgi:hypothetical protein
MPFRYGADPWVVTVALLALLVGCGEVAYRLGRRSVSRTTAGVLSQFGTVQASVLGTLALLLGFTFAMSASRYDAHRRLVVDEANAIGTSYLRCDVLSDPARSEMRELLRRYVDARLAFGDAGANESLLQAAIVTSEHLQTAIWSRAADEARKDPHAVTSALLLQSINQMIDLCATRVIALETRVPRPILVLLGVAAVAAVGAVAFGFGLVGHSHLRVTIFLALLVSVTILTILDLDQPRYGRIQVSQRSLQLLRDTIDPSRQGGPGR